MEIKTKRFGSIDIDEKQIFEFEKGLLAFEDYKNFVLLDIPQNPAFKWLQSTEDPGICFLLVDPFLVKKDYEIQIDDSLKKQLEINKKEDVLIYTIVTIPESGFKNATTNLLGPIVLNIKKHKGKQIVLDRDDECLKYPIFPKNAKKASCGG